MSKNGGWMSLSYPTDINQNNIKNEGDVKMSEFQLNLELANLPQSIPSDLRKCFIDTVKQILNEQKLETRSKNILRINHMINTSYITQAICRKTSGINNIDTTIITAAALFHDIFKLFDDGKVSINIKGLDIKFAIDDESILEDSHAELGALFMEAVFKANKNSIKLGDLHIARMCEAIKVHSDKKDELYTKTNIQKILVEADILEKISVGTLLKLFNKDPKLDNEFIEVICKKRDKFINLREVFSTSYAIELYTERLKDFDSLIKFMINNKISE